MRNKRIAFKIRPAIFCGQKADLCFKCFDAFNWEETGKFKKSDRAKHAWLFALSAFPSAGKKQEKEWVGASKRSISGRDA